MKRNVAFFISNNRSKKNHLRGLKHFEELAQRHSFELFSYFYQSLSIYIIYESKIQIEFTNSGLKFPIGNLDSSELNSDRFLKILIKKDLLEIENDYAGSIPVYYSTRNHLSISNIEPCVMIDSNSTTNDISNDNLYGFLRYSHFIWDETLYDHIFKMTPDSRYTFKIKNLAIEQKYLKTVVSSEKNIGLSNYEVAKKLNDLNDDLVHKSLEKYDQIILPLSSGYDSRMILASLAKRNDLKEKLYCFTYGSEGSLEVEAARRLTYKLGIKWSFIQLPRRFLSYNYLKEIHDIFGSSLHMHGMYQLEFFDEISKKIEIKENACLTSGFMTGVPAGQHNSLLSISASKKLTESMNIFSQSNYWSDEELNKRHVFRNKNFIKNVEKRFKSSFDRFEGLIHQKSVVFDVWTRQSNFIGYYPRSLEWKIPVVSPHMNTRYINFFMSLSETHLNDRYAVELMFKKFYPDLSKIISNSNGLKSINSYKENFIFFTSRVLNKLKLSRLIPKKYANNTFDFDIDALKKTKELSIYPLLSCELKFLEEILTKEEILRLYQKALEGDNNSYYKLIGLQSIGFSLLKMEHKLN